MDLSLHIEQLLYNNDCVIIPDIGGFIVNYTSASIDLVDQQVYPPKKTVSFNPKLVNNDGLLASEIVEHQHLTFKQANQAVKEYCEQIENDLNNNKTIHFNNIGRLYFNKDSKLEFIPANTNFLRDAFGLPELECSPILRNKNYLKTAENNKNIKPTVVKKQTSIVDLLINSKMIGAAAILILVLSTPYIYNALFTGMANNNNNITMIDSNSTSHASLLPSSTVTLSDSHKVMSEVAEEEIEPEIPIEEPTVQENLKDYVIVLGAFSKQKNVDRLSKKLKADNLLVDISLKNGLTRVGVQITCTKDELKTQLEFVRANYNKKAWLVQ
ncbi:MAG: hypothetical protein MK207_08385 [Saprospiraceae bacterium]|nr:hypothetical protein [Saprospiraceae bacterium]